MCLYLRSRALLSTPRPKLSTSPSPPTRATSCQGSSLLHPSLCRPQPSRRPPPPQTPPPAPLPPLQPPLTAPPTQPAPLQSPPSPSAPPQQSAQLHLPPHAPQDSHPRTAKPPQGFPPLSPPHLPPHLHFQRLTQHLRSQWPQFICKDSLTSFSTTTKKLLLQFPKLPNSNELNIPFHKLFIHKIPLLQSPFFPRSNLVASLPIILMQSAVCGADYKFPNV